MNILLKKLIKSEYSRNKYITFKKLFHKIENKSRRKRTTPLTFLIRRKNTKNTKISKRYLFSVSRKKNFKLKRTDFIKRLLKGSRNIVILPLHIDNKVHSVQHLNILIINLKKRTVRRVESTSPWKSKIKTRNVNKTFTRFFCKLGFKYIGINKNTKYIPHHGMCRFATPLMYLSGNNSYPQIKRAVIRYSKYLLK